MTSKRFLVFATLLSMLALGLSIWLWNGPAVAGWAVVVVLLLAFYTRLTTSVALGTRVLISVALLRELYDRPNHLSASVILSGFHVGEEGDTVLRFRREDDQPRAS